MEWTPDPEGWRQSYAEAGYLVVENAVDPQLIPHQEVKPGDTDMDEAVVPSNRVSVICPAGSAVLFHVNIVHGGGPNLSQTKRRNVIGIWSGPGSYPTTPHRFAYHNVMPRSTEPMRQRQIQMTFGAHGP